MTKPLVAVRWLDAHGSGTTSAYAEHEIPHHAIEITSYGLLLRDDAEGVSIANETCADGTYRGHTFVLRCLVVDVKHLVPTRKLRRRKSVVLQIPPGEQLIPGALD